MCNSRKNTFYHRSRFLTMVTSSITIVNEFTMITYHVFSQNYHGLPRFFNYGKQNFLATMVSYSLL